MPIDAAIPLQVKPPEPIDPLAQYGKLFQLQSMQQQAQAGALDVQQKAQTLKDMQAMDRAWQQPGGREAVLNALPGHLKMKASQQFMEIDKLHAETQLATEKAADAQAESFGRAAVAVREHDYEPLAAQAFLSDLKTKYAGDPQTSARLQQFEQQIQTNPTPEAIKAIIDPIIAQSSQRKVDIEAKTADARAKAAAKPTDATLAVDAQNPQSPTATASAAALDRLKPKPEPSLQSENVLLDGKTAQVTFNPKTGRRFNAAGEDVTGRTKPIPAAALQVSTGALDDVKESVKGMIDGTIPPQMPGRASKEYLATLAEAHRQGYDLKAAVLDFGAVQKHLATLNGAQQTRLRQSISTAAQSLDVIDDLADQWNSARVIKDGKIVPLNKAELAAAKSGVYGQKAQSIATQLEGQITDVTSELGNVYMGGNSPTDHALQLAGKNLSADWSAQTLKDMTKLARTNLKIRNNSIVNSVAILSSGEEKQPDVSAIPDAVSAALKGAKAGRHTLSDGSVWDISATGAISKVK
jgi:hypothetical protein